MSRSAESPDTRTTSRRVASLAALVVALLTGLAMLSAVSVSAGGHGGPAGFAAARHCPSFNAGGFRISGVRAFALPCSLGRAAVRAYARQGFPDTSSVRFKAGTGRADFGCYLYPSGVGLDGKCKGGVTKKNGHVYPYGTVDWRRRKPVMSMTG